MKAKILTPKEYYEYFLFRQKGTGCQIEQEYAKDIFTGQMIYGEKYLKCYTLLPKSFFDVLAIPTFIDQQLPDKLIINFELIAKGKIGHKDAFIFRPWVNIQNNINPPLFRYLENFLLFMVDTLFYNLIDRLLFMESFSLKDFGSVRILQEIDPITFNRFGLDRIQVPRYIKTKNLELVRIEESEINIKEMINFFKINGYEISDNLIYMYFRPKLNTWFKVKLRNNLIGYIRLYNRDNVFSGGTSIEYIIEKSKRNKGYATEATMGIIDYLKNYSYAFSVGAQVNDDNIASQRVVEKCGFSPNKIGTWDDDNYFLWILDNLENFLNRSQLGFIDINIDYYYAIRYKLYLD